MVETAEDTKAIDREKESDAIMRAAFDRLEAGERPPNSSGRVELTVKDDEDEEDVETEAAAEKAAPADEEKKNATKDAPAPVVERDAEREREENTLRRAKLPESVIAKLTPEERAAFVAAQSKQLGAADDAFRQLREYQAQEETTEKKRETRVATPAVQPLNFSEAVKPLVALGLGEEAEPALQAFANAISEPLRTENEELKGSLLELRSVFGEQCAERSRDKLRERFPEFAQDSVWNEVWSDARAVIATGAFKDAAPTLQGRFDKAIERSAYAIISPLREQTNTRKASDKKRSAGQANSQSRPKSIDSMSLDERQYEAFKRFEKGEDPNKLKQEFELG